MANQYLYDLTDTWNNVATTFDAIKINVTDTNSATASKLLDLQVGGVSKFKVQKDGDVTADRLTVTKTTANAPAISSTGYSLTGSNATSLVDLAGTWNTSGTPTAIKLNVTETSTPNSASFLLDLQRGGVSQFSVRRDGTTIAKGTFDTSANLNVAGNAFLYGSSSYLAFGTTYDAILRGDAANTLAQRNAANAQTFNIYNTYSSSTSYERLSIVCQSADSVLIRTNKGSNGGSARALILGTDGTNALTLTTAQKAEFAATIKTAAPAGGTAAEWKLGTVASVTPTSPDRTIEVDIGGTIYYIHAKTTNN